VIKEYNSDYEIIVVNDGENTISINDDKVKVFKNPKKGVASARNLGVANSIYDNLLFIDDDIIIASEVLNNIISFFNSDKSINYCYTVMNKMPNELTQKCLKTNFGRYLVYLNSLYTKGWMENSIELIKNELYEVENSISQCLAITKDNFYKVGGYNENYPFAGFEDYDFSVRIKKAGIKVLFNTKDLILHNEEDRININSWLKRRYNEGASRAVYVNITQDKKFLIKHSFFKRMIFKLFYIFTKPILLIPKILDYEVFDKFNFLIFKIIGGAYIWKGYKEYAK
jgi:GT2 family glycosyltransferase